MTYPSVSTIIRYRVDCEYTPLVNHEFPYNFHAVLRVLTQRASYRQNVCHIDYTAYHSPSEYRTFKISRLRRVSSASWGFVSSAFRRDEGGGGDQDIIGEAYPHGPRRYNSRKMLWRVDHRKLGPISKHPEAGVFDTQEAQPVNQPTTFRLQPNERSPNQISQCSPHLAFALEIICQAWF